MLSKENVAEGNANSPSTAGETRPKHSRWRLFFITFSSFLLNFSGCGLLFSWGIYQSLYEDLSRHDDNPFSGASSAQITLIGSIGASLMKLGAPFAVAWSKQYNPRAVVFAGGLLYGVSSVLASFGTTLWHFQICQGLLIGIATCLSFMPSMIVPPGWFGRHRGFLMGVISSGTGVGGLVWSPILRICIVQVGYRNTLRLTGCICAALICASSIPMEWDPYTAARFASERKTGPLWRRLFYVPLPTKSMFLSRKFFAQSLSATLQSAAYYTPVFYIATYSKSLGFDATQGSNFTALSNACNAIGKIGVGFVADYVGRLESFFLTTLLSSVSTAGLWVPSTLQSSGSLFIAFTVIYGLFASAYVGLFSPCLIELFGSRDQHRIVGHMYMLQGAAALAGTPIAGALITGDTGFSDPRNYVYMALFTGLLMIFSTVCVFWSWMELLGEKRKSRVAAVPTP